MPAYSTHYLFAYELMEKIKNNVNFEIDEQAIYIGTQGPDIFYDCRIMPWMVGKPLLSVGKALHNAKPCNIFNAMKEYINNNSHCNIEKSYITGFILHYILDKNCHPYVYSFQNLIQEKNPKSNSFTAHSIVEFAMDSYLLNKHLYVDKPTLFNTYNTLNYNKITLNACGKIIAYTVNNSTNKNITQKQAEQAIKDIKYIQKLTFDPSGNKKKAVSIIEDLLSLPLKNLKATSLMRIDDIEFAKKFANENNKLWYSPYDKDRKRFESFEELFEESKDEALNFINIFFNNGDCYKATHNLSFLTGLEVK